MARFGSLGTQYFTNSGETLSFGYIQFFEPGTTTEKNTYANEALTIENEWPLPLDAAGRQPNCFFDGSAKAVLKSQANVQIAVADPVGESPTNFIFTWQPSFTYPLGALVISPVDDNYYISTAGNNQNHEPSVSVPAWWLPWIDYLIKIQGLVDPGYVAIGDATTGLTGIDMTAKGGLLVGDGTTAPQVLAVGANDLVLAAASGETTGLKYVANGIQIVAAGGTVDAITATYSPAIALVDKQLAMFISSGANTSTTPTFAPNGLTAHTITKDGGQALVAGSIGAAGYVGLLEYNLANTRWELLNPVSTQIGIGDHCVTVYTLNGYGSTNTKIPRYTTTLENVGTAITYADSAANGASFTINETGLYLVERADDEFTASTTFYYGASLNSASLTTDIQSLTPAEIVLITQFRTAGAGGEFAVPVNTIAAFTAGDVVRPHDTGTLNGNSFVNCRFTIRKIGLIA